MNSIYLDWNATTPLLPAALEAMSRVQTEAIGNPSSSHHAGRLARRFLEDAREQIAGLLSANPAEVIFTSGATEANNLAILGLLPPFADASGSGKHHILAAPIEHPCVVEPLKVLEKRGFDVEWLPVTVRGQVEQRTGVERVRPQTRLVCLMFANHETGAIQPVRHVSKTLPKSVALHCDAAQAVGKVPIDFHDLGVTTLTASAHKFGGPKGIGILLLKAGTLLRPLAHGGHQQHGHRPGTEPVALAVGMAAALAESVRNLDANREKLNRLRERFLTRLAPLQPIVNGPAPAEPDSLPTTLNLSFRGIRADVLLMKLDLAGVACSTGSACSSGSLLPSPVLQAMHVPEEVLRSGMRFSFGASLSESDIDNATDRIRVSVESIHGRNI